MKKLIALILLLFSGLSWAGAFEDGVAALQRNDYDSALLNFESAANQGDAKSQVKLALMYYFGKGVPQNKLSSAYWLNLAVNQGSPDAQFYLGGMHLRGEVFLKDYEKALKLYLLAAAQNHVEAQFNLGLMYYKGDGVKQNLETSFKYFSLAASQKYLPAFDYLCVMYYEGKSTLQHISAYQACSVSAEQGNSFSQFVLGSIYYEGREIPKNNLLAYMWVNLSATKIGKTAFNSLTAIANDMTSEEIAQAERLGLSCLYQDFKDCNNIKEEPKLDSSLQLNPNSNNEIIEEQELPFDISKMNIFIKRELTPEQQIQNSRIIQSIAKNSSGPVESYTAPGSGEIEQARQKKEAKIKEDVGFIKAVSLSSIVEYLITIAAVVGIIFLKRKLSSHALKEKTVNTSNSSINYFEIIGGSLAFIILITFLLSQLIAAFLGIAHHWGLGWAFILIPLFFHFKLAVPFSVAAFFGALNVWEWHWVVALCFVSPGFLLIIPGIALSIVSVINSRFNR